MMQRFVERETRLRYLQFKRLTWLAEMFLFVMIMIVLYGFWADVVVRTLVLTIQGLRVLTELLNHYALGNELGFPDKWHIYPFF